MLQQESYCWKVHGFVFPTNAWKSCHTSLGERQLWHFKGKTEWSIFKISDFLRHQSPMDGFLSLHRSVCMEEKIEERRRLAISDSVRCLNQVHTFLHKTRLVYVVLSVCLSTARKNCAIRIQDVIKGRILMRVNNYFWLLISTAQLLKARCWL